MASTSTPYGALPQNSQSGIVRTLRIPFGIASGLSSNIFKGQPVKMVAASGTITPITSTSDAIFGFFAGVEFTPTGGRPAESPFWPANTSYDSTYDMLVYIWPAWLPDLRIRVQADGSVAQTLLGASFNFSNIAAGSTSTGLSACTVAAAGVASGSPGQLTLIEFSNAVGSSVGDAYTDLICMVAQPQVGYANKNSIG